MIILFSDTVAEFTITKPAICDPKRRTKVNAEVKTFGQTHATNYIYGFLLIIEFGAFDEKFEGLIGNNILNEINCIILKENWKAPHAETPSFDCKEEEYYDKIHNGRNYEILNCQTKQINDVNKLNNFEEKNQLLKMQRKYNYVFYNENDKLDVHKRH